LNKLYDWAEAKNMTFNGLKFECVKYGKSDVKLDYTYLNPIKTDAIEETDTVRDLGILLSSNAQFNEHIDMVIKKAKKKVSWIRRSFVRNDVSFMRKRWRTYIEGAMDYGSEVWSQIKTTKLAYLETVLKSNLSHIDGLNNMNHRVHLKAARLSSIQRRNERYKFFYI